jgi:hypothetical protein
VPDQHHRDGVRERREAGQIARDRAAEEDLLPALVHRSDRTQRLAVGQRVAIEVLAGEPSDALDLVAVGEVPEELCASCVTAPRTASRFLCVRARSRRSQSPTRRGSANSPRISTTSGVATRRSARNRLSMRTLPSAAGTAKKYFADR